MRGGGGGGGEGGGPAGQRGKEEAGCAGVWGSERRRDSAEQPGTAATAARAWAAVRPGRPSWTDHYGGRAAAFALRELCQ